jgi:hypothetical protein
MYYRGTEGNVVIWGGEHQVDSFPASAEHRVIGDLKAEILTVCAVSIAAFARPRF